MNMTLTSRLFRRAVKKDDLAIALALPGRAPLTRSQLLNLMENGGNLFITGSAGSGKSTLLREFVSKTGRKAAICAGTGLAALNVNGQTIHSLFQINPFNPDRSPNPHSFSKELFQALDVLIIDEISSVHANLFDKVDERLRWLRGNRRPFGGLRVILIGDYYQLPPIPGEEQQASESSYAFNSAAYRVLDIKNIVLTTDHRQKDRQFIDALNSIKAKNPDIGKALAFINQQAGCRHPDREENPVLTTTNRRAKEINERMLDALPGESRAYQAGFTGKFDSSTPDRGLPADRVVTLKKDALVIMTNNDPEHRWVNGTLARVEWLGADEIGVVIRGTDEHFSVERHEWEKYRQVYDSDEDKIRKEATGTYLQFPLRLAWAMTIHKSQGQTFEKVTVDFSEKRPWAHGQTYVALSRCTTLDGISLVSPVLESDIVIDPGVIRFLHEQKIEDDKI
jgi:ATP-dependent DNA helicase PIF1